MPIKNPRVTGNWQSEYENDYNNRAYKTITPHKVPSTNEFSAPDIPATILVGGNTFSAAENF